MASLSNTQRTFVDGTLMRQVFIPYKEIIMEFVSKIQSGAFFPVHSLLSASFFEFDKILLSVRLNPNSMTDYLKPVPDTWQ